MKKQKIISTSIFLFLAALYLFPSSALAQWNMGNITGYGLPSNTVTGIIRNILLWLLFMLGIIGLIGFVISGLMYILASGDETLLGRAKKGMTYSIIGMIVGMAGLVIIQAISNILNSAYYI